jgi:hypothetical protein
MTACPDLRQRKRLCSRRDRGRFSRSTVGGRRSERLAEVALSFALRRPLSQPFQGFTSGAQPAQQCQISPRQWMWGGISGHSLAGELGRRFVVVRGVLELAAGEPRHRADCWEFLSRKRRVRVREPVLCRRPIPPVPVMVTGRAERHDVAQRELSTTTTQRHDVVKWCQPPQQRESSCKASAIGFSTRADARSPASTAAMVGSSLAIRPRGSGRCEPFAR